MNKLTFAITFFLSVVLLLAKTYFFFSESVYLYSPFSSLELIVLVVLLIVTIASFLRAELEITPFVRKIDVPSAFQRGIMALLLVGVGLIVLISFLHTRVKAALDWDAVALYDARAQFLQSGLRFSEMKSLTTYDTKNGYYYSLYPPFTSLLHLAWYEAGVPFTISTLYSTLFLIFAVGIFSLFVPRLGASWSLLALFVLLGQKLLFTTSLVAYTNLPFTLYLSLGVLLLHKYLHEPKLHWLLLSIALIAGSQWIRALEPTWLAILLPFALITLKKFGIKASITRILVFMLICIMQYLSWRYFTEVISDKEGIFRSSLLFLLEPVAGVFSGSFLLIMKAYINMWGSGLLLYLAAIASSLLGKEQEEQDADYFLGGVIVFSFLMYFSGLYFISFQFDWWPEMGGSLLRSSTFLLPISIYLLVKTVKALFRK